MVKKVFCYSEEVAKRHGNHLSYKGVQIGAIIFLISFMVLLIFACFLENINIYFQVTFTSMIIMVLSMFFVFGYTLKAFFSFICSTASYVIDNENRIFQVAMINDAAEFLCVRTDHGNSPRNVFLFIEAFVFHYPQTVSKMKEKLEFISNPDVVENLFYDDSGLHSNVFEILKVRSIKEKRKSFVIRCDYKYIQAEKVNKRRKIMIKKTYNDYEELIGYLKKK